MSESNKTNGLSLALSHTLLKEKEEEKHEQRKKRIVNREITNLKAKLVKAEIDDELHAMH